MSFTIRRALPDDSNRISELLADIADLHHRGRPDIFKPACQKYSKEELISILQDENKPVFVAADECGTVVGYVFCLIVHHHSHAVFQEYTSLYIDDFCIDESCRGQGIGKSLFQAVKEYAKEKGVYNIDLNGWEFNENAIHFYETCGFTTQRRHMEIIV